MIECKGIDSCENVCILVFDNVKGFSMYFYALILFDIAVEDIN